jgi:hypothetical protein
VTPSGNGSRASRAAPNGWSSSAPRARAEAPPPSAEDVKAEAYRRITAVYPAWKQVHIIARAAELDRIQSGRMRNAGGSPVPPRALTPEEVAEEQATAAAWTWIKSIRAASDALEAMSPIPADYTNEAHWPE